MTLTVSTITTLLLLFPGGVICRDPVIKKDIQIYPEVMKLGDWVNLECWIAYLDDDPTNIIQWFHRRFGQHDPNPPFLVTSNMEAVHVPGDPPGKYEPKLTRRGDLTTVYELTVYHLNINDDGWYECYIQRYGIRLGTEVKIMVPPRMIPPSQPVVTVAIGGTASLTCKADGYPLPYYRWRRLDGHRLPNNSLMVKGPVLVLPNVTRLDAGLIRCLAINTVPPLDPRDSIFDMTLDVQFKPVARPVQPTYGQTSRGHNSVRMECFIQGNPSPTLRWYFTNPTSGQKQELTDGEYGFGSFYLSEHLSHGSYIRKWTKLSVLHVTLVTGASFGNYTCEGSNILGRGSAQILLFYTDFCQGVDCQKYDVDDQESSAAILMFSSFYISLVLITSLHPILK